MSTTTTIEERLAALEARPVCNCQDCRQRAKDAKDRADREYAYAMLELRTPALIAAISAMGYVALHKVTDIWDNRLIEVCLAVDDATRERLLTCTTSLHIRTTVAVHLDERAGKLAPRVRVRRVREWHGDPIPGTRIEIPASAAPQLRAVGIKVGSDGWAAHERWFFYSDTILQQLEYTRAEYDVRLRFDTRLQRLLETGIVVVEDFTREETINAEIASRKAAAQDTYRLAKAPAMS